MNNEYLIPDEDEEENDEVIIDGNNPHGTPKEKD